MTTKEVCPICNGCGSIDRVSDLSNTQKKTMQRVLIARKLKSEGWSYRQIMKKMKLKSTSTVDYYLKHVKS